MIRLTQYFIATLLISPAFGPACTAQLAAEIGDVPSPEDSRKTLFIAIDAVPIDIMRRVAADPDNLFFHALPSPVPLISTFPSTTSLALAAIQQPLGIQASPGYENKYYDWQTNKITGGGLVSYEPFPWRKSFDWKVEGLKRKATSAMRPIKASRRDIRESLEAFVESSRRSFFIYYDTTDSAVHLRGPEGLIPILEELDLRLVELRQSHPSLVFDLVIFSDHGIDGGEPLKNVRKPVTQALKKAGFKRRDKLKQEGDYVITPFGLVSSFVLYTHKGQEAPAALAIVNVDEVAMCAYREAEGWEVVDRSGHGSFLRRDAPSRQWKYSYVGDDPLHLAQLWTGSATADGWIDDSRILAGTEDAFYPDPLHRIAEAFTLVHNPASIICSTTGNGDYGSKSTSFGARLSGGRLRWTHGALHREATMGFFMTDIEGLQPESAVRFDEALVPFLDRFDPSTPHESAQ